MDKYKACVRANKRTITCEVDITLDRAIDFLDETKDGIIFCDNKELTKEELEYAKSIRSLPGIGEDNVTTSGESLHEDSYRELFEAARYNAESGTECDN